MTIFTVGHSTRPLEEFVGLVAGHGVKQVADVRTVPKSRRHPQFSREALELSLPAHGLSYRHLAALGGLRRPRRDSTNTAWQNESFRGYADYMETQAFSAGLEMLLAFAEGRPTAIMCAEAVWWRCHRRLIADALVARGIDVRHIVSAAQAEAHRLTEFATVVEGRVSYPGLV